MRTVRVVLRPDSQTSVKICTNVRLRGRRTPKQLHLGYVSLLRTDIQPGKRRKMQAHLETRWLELFGDRDVQVDWEDAERKLRQFILARGARPEAAE